MGAGPQAARPAAVSNTAEVEPRITLRRNDPKRIVFLEHTGSYWSLGPLFTPVKEAMTKHRQTGPMFLRYSADPATTSPKLLRTQIGFFANGDCPVEPPFNSESLEGEDVAAAFVQGPYGTTTRYYSTVREWIERQGHEMTGPVIEIYAPDHGRKLRDVRVEIQVPVKLAVAAKPPATKPVADPPAVGVSAEAPLPSLSVVPTEAEPVLPIRELIEANRFERVAEQLMPGDRPMPAAFQLWFGQVVFRLGAIAKGLAQSHPAAAAPVTALSEALLARYRQVTAGSSADPLAQAVIRVDPATDSTAARKRAVMREVDTLLGRVAAKGVEPAAAMDHLTGILQGIQDLISAPYP
jgi:effector-binding domain-containing protein